MKGGDNGKEKSKGEKEADEKANEQKELLKVSGCSPHPVFIKPKYAWIYEPGPEPIKKAPTPQEMRERSLQRLRQYENIAFTYLGKRARGGE